MKVSKITYL
jgi:sphinganine-1-phosphate aldolase